jgi:hypothetical protein
MLGGMWEFGLDIRGTRGCTQLVRRRGGGFSGGNMVSGERGLVPLGVAKESEIAVLRASARRFLLLAYVR